MATQTTNLGLIKPGLTDKIRIAQINGNMDILDNVIGAVGNTSLQTQMSNAQSSVSALQDGLAIVSNNNAHPAIAQGQYVYVKNHGSLDEGLYVATTAIAANGTLSASNLTADSGGGLNTLSATLSEQIAKVANAAVVTDFNTCTETGVYCGNSASNSPISGWVILSVIRLADQNNWVVQVAHETNNNRYFVRSRDSGTWRNWEQLMRNSSFTPSSYTAPTNIHSNATLTHGGYVRIGNMVVVNARFNIHSQIAAGDVVAKCPGYNLQASQVALTNNKGLDLGLNQSGEMKSPAAITIGTFVVSGTYFVV